MKPFFGIAVAAEEIGLPRTVGGDAGNLVHLGLVGDRVGGVGRARRHQEIDLVAQDQLGRDLGGARGARLAVAREDLHRIGLAAVADALLEQLLDLLENERIGLAEGRDRAGARAHMADLDDARLRIGGQHAQHRGRRDGAEAGRHDAAAADGSWLFHGNLPGGWFIKMVYCNRRRRAPS